MDKEAIREELERAGYAFVQTEPRLLEKGGASSPDIVAWAADDDGALVPWAVVELKSGGGPAGIESALPQLARHRERLGTTRHYVVAAGQWYQADDGLRMLAPVESPSAPPFGSDGALRDPQLLTRVLTDRIYAEVDHSRSSRVDPFTVAARVISEAAETGRVGLFRVAKGYEVRVDRAALFRASRSVLVQVAERVKENGLHGVDPQLAEAMAALAGSKLSGTVLDPYARIGTLLWAAMDRAVDEGLATHFHGNELRDSLVEAARAVSLSAPLPASIELTGSEAFGPFRRSDLIITIPPFGLQRSGVFRDGHELLDGTSTQDGDLIVVDNILRSLAPDGRAVLVLPSSFTHSAKGDAYRRFLASQFRVAALIGLAGALGPSIHPSLQVVLLVIDRAPAGETFVAQLSSDWTAQLAPGGAAREAAIAHIDSTSIRGH